jgi:type II restriction/modification system DNA methylase subunit YeeA
MLSFWVNGMDITSRPRSFWIINFGTLSQDEASKYEGLFAYVVEHIRPERIKNADKQRREFWWRLGRSGSDWKEASTNLDRTIFTPRVSKHRLFAWFGGNTLPDSAAVGFARSDDFFFGVLHSRFHEVWALKLGTRLETRPRYTPTTCFETFPFPQPTPEQEAAIAAAAKELNELRERWLNPPDWTVEKILEFPGSVNGPWARYIVSHSTLDTRHSALKLGTVRYPRLEPKDAECAKKLKDRTLTNLYNERPTWLDRAHKKLDETVAAAYGWPADLPEAEILKRLLELNLQRADVEAKMEKPRLPRTSRSKREDELI